MTMDLNPIANGAISAGQGAGFLSPTGSPLLMAALRRFAMRNSRSRGRSNEVAARLAGLNPWQQRQASVDTNREASGQVADTLNAGQLGQLQGAEDWTRGLFGSQLGEQHRRDATHIGIGAMLAGLLGQGAGALAGGVGGAAAGGISKRLTGGGGAGSEYDQPYG